MNKLIKIILMGLTVFILPNIVFAVGDITATNSNAIGNVVYGIINFLNIIWLPFAILAGKLFTNDLVYGTFLHIDVILWKIWNFSKNIALFILGFGFIFLIFKSFLGKDKIFSDIGKFILAAILVPLSWFIIGVLVDFSTILLSVVGSLPLKILGNSNIIENKKVSICTNVIFSGDIKFSTDMIKCTNEQKIDFLDLLQKANSLSSSLIYLGQSILLLDRNWADIKTTNLKANGKNPAKAISLSLIFKLLVLALFVIPLFVLIIIGIIRIFWLWIYIGFSPLIILDQIFGGKVLGKKPQFKFSNMLGLIFQPVFIIFAMSMVIVFVSILRDSMVLNYTTGNSNAVSKELGVCNKNSLCIKDKPIVTFKGDLFKDFWDNVGGFLGYLIFLILISAVLFSLLKIASKSTEITASIVDNVYKFGEEAFKAIKIIPTPYGAVGIGAVERALSKALIKSDFDVKAAQQAESLINKIYKIAGIQTSDISIAELKEFKEELRPLSAEKSIINKLEENLQKILSSPKYADMVIVNSPHFQEFVYAYLEKMYRKSSNKDIFEKIGAAKKDKNGQLTFVSQSELFQNPKFGQFLTALIKAIKEKNSTVLSAPNFGVLYNNLALTDNRLTQPLKDWK